MGISSMKSQKVSRGFTTVLASAFFEWLLMFMLFIDGIFSYLVTKFARSCALQVPCLLCSRLDHVLGKENFGFYWDLICSNHKLEISSLVLCYAHNKLVNGHEICDNCLFSSATMNESKAEIHSLSVGKLGKETNSVLDHVPLLDKYTPSSSSTRHCSCCSEPYISGESDKRLFQTKPIESEAAELDQSLSVDAGHDHENVKKKQYILPGSAKPPHLTSNRIDPLSHIGYAELKITSDTESELLLSEEDDANTIPCPTNDSEEPKETKDDVTVHCVLPVPRVINLTDDLITEKLIIPNFVTKPSDALSPVQSSAVKLNETVSEEVTPVIEHALEELDWENLEVRADPSESLKLAHVDDAPASLNCAETTVESSKEILDDAAKLNEAVSEAATAAAEHGFMERDWQKLEVKADPSGSPKVADIVDTTASLKSAETAVESSKEILDDAEANAAVETSVTEKVDISKARSGPVTGRGIGLENEPVTIDNVHQLPTSLDLGDAYRLAVSNRGRQSSVIPSEQRTGKDSAKVSGDFKVLLSQLSSRGFELPLNDISPRVSGNIDDLRTFDSSTSSGLYLLQKRISLERNESGLSLDGSMVNEIEGESLVDRLKRQVEHDRKTMIALYKELEEERNASAVSANEAMAMITRLQEEKAALHMEALQYLRMMEEQAEYDMEALQKANDLLAEKEKEMQDLEDELEFLKQKSPDETMLENMVQPTCDPEVEAVKMESSDTSSVEHNVGVHSGNVVMVKSKISDKIERKDLSFDGKHMDNMKNSLLEIEEESLYISEHLKILEKKLHLFSNNEEHSLLPNGEYSRNEGNGVSDSKEMKHKEGSQEDCGMEEMDLPVQKNVAVLRGHVASSEHSQSISKESDQSSSMLCGENDLIALGNEISDLNDRLKALEADHDFLQHTINSLRKGDEGLQFIQQIASDLQELRKIGVQRRDGTVS